MEKIKSELLGWMGKFTKKSIALGSSVLVVVLAIVIGFMLASHTVTNKNITKGRTEHFKPVCSPTIINEAAGSFSYSMLNILSSTVKQIKSSSGYSKDANCMYILSAYYYLKSDVNMAVSSLDQLNADLNTGQKLNKMLLYYKSLSTLRTDISYLNKVYQQDSRNSAALSPTFPETTVQSK